MAMSYLVPPDCCANDQPNKDYSIFSTSNGDAVVCAHCADMVCEPSQLPKTVLDQMEDLR